MAGWAPKLRQRILVIVLAGRHGGDLPDDPLADRAECCERSAEPQLWLARWPVVAILR
jgi:hypothetical protein